MPAHHNKVHLHHETGITDEVASEAHQIIHHAEQEQHEHDAAAKRGLPDQAIDAEREMMDLVEHDLDENNKPVTTKIKEKVNKVAGTDL